MLLSLCCRDAQEAHVHVGSLWRTRDCRPGPAVPVPSCLWAQIEGRKKNAGPVTWQTAIINISCLPLSKPWPSWSLRPATSAEGASVLQSRASLS